MAATKLPLKKGLVPMDKITSTFFSKILHKEILNISGQVIGRLSDLVLDFTQVRPTVIYIRITNGRRAFYVSADALNISKDAKEKHVIKIDSDQLLIKLPTEDDIYLARDFLDKQIVDINGRKVERVNDVRLAYVNKKWMLIAVDIGTRGILRRLGVEYPIIKTAETFKYRFRNKLIFWDDVQPLSSGRTNLQLSDAAHKLETMHAADLADIIEDLDNINRDIIFNSLDVEKAAEVLEEIEQDVQLDILNAMSDEKASDILEIMPSDEIADILEEIEEDRAEKILAQMDADSQEEVRELMEYKDNTVGSIMSKDFISFLPDKTVSDVITWFKENLPDSEESFYVYITNSKNNLLGTIPLISLLTNDSSAKLYDIMQPQPETMQDNEPADEAVELMQKYSLVMVPVLDENNELVGTISMNDIINEYIEQRRVTI